MSVADEGAFQMDAVDELVTANHILAFLGILDAFGHISCRHPDRADRFLMSRARAPALIERDDIMEFELDGTPVDGQERRPYIERFIHAAIYARRPDVRSVVHDHSRCVIPFTVSSTPLRPISNSGGPLGGAVPVWDLADKFGDCTNLLVVNMAMGEDLAETLGQRPMMLMRGHGAVVAAPSIRWATFLSIGLDAEAKAVREAMQLGDVKYLLPGEIETTGQIHADAGTDALGRAWEYWCRQVNRPFSVNGY